MKVVVDTVDETIEVQGVVYSLHVFQLLATLPIGTTLEILSRDNGLVTVKQSQPKTEA
jgi:hypothetical protein